MKVFFSIHSLQMLRVETAFVSAPMVDLRSPFQRTHPKEISSPVRFGSDAAPIESAVPKGIPIPHVEPTPRRAKFAMIEQTQHHPGGIDSAAAALR